MPSLFDALDRELPAERRLQTSGLLLVEAATSGSAGVVLDPKIHPMPDRSGVYQRCGGGRRVIRKPIGSN